MNETTEQINRPDPTVGSYWYPDRGQISSAIQCLQVNEQGFQFRRWHLYHNGETFFLQRRNWLDSKWIEVPIGSQLCFA